MRDCVLRQKYFRSIATWCALLGVLIMLPACAGDGKFGQTTMAPSPIAKPGDIKKSAYAQRALSFLDSNRARYGITDAKAELVYISESVDELKQAHVRFQQVHRGVPVWGQQLIAHFDGRGEPSSMSGTFLPIAPPLDTKPHIDKHTAAANVVKAKGSDWKVLDCEPVIFPHDKRASLAHLIIVTRALRREFVFVDASDGSLLAELSGSPDIN